VPTKKASITEAILSAIKSQEHKAQSLKATITFSSDKVAQINGYPHQITQVFVNLISNALDAISNELVKKVIVTLDEDEGSWIISVQDSGPGIPEKNRDKVFDTLYTTKGNSGGTGLGLGICKRIVEAHYGQIKVSNGVESKLIVKLPKSLPATLPAIHS
jgi:two-component system NtrC family sensor kinase